MAFALDPFSHKVVRGAFHGGEYSTHLIQAFVFSFDERSKRVLHPFFAGGGMIDLFYETCD